MPLEQIIRPFQSPAAIPDKRTVVTRPVVAAPEHAILVWGAAGQAPIIEALNLKVKNNENTLKEVSRKTTDVRVTNPDDDNQYVMEQRIDKIQFSKKPTLITPSQSGPVPGVDTGNNSGDSGGAATGTAAGKAPDGSTVNNPTVSTGNQGAQQPVETKENYILVQPPQPPQ